MNDLSSSISSSLCWKAHGSTEWPIIIDFPDENDKKLKHRKLKSLITFWPVPYSMNNIQYCHWICMSLARSSVFIRFIVCGSCLIVRHDHDPLICILFIRILLSNESDVDSGWKAAVLFIVFWTSRCPSCTVCLWPLLPSCELSTKYSMHNCDWRWIAAIITHCLPKYIYINVCILCFFVSTVQIAILCTSLQFKCHIVVER